MYNNNAHNTDICLQTQLHVYKCYIKSTLYAIQRYQLDTVPLYNNLN